MIQRYNDILQEIQYFNELFQPPAQIQKIYSSSYYISLQIRLPGKNVFLYIGRGHGHEGFWSSEKQIPSFLRKKDRLLEYLRKYLSSSVLGQVDLDKKDRIIRIKYRRFGKVSTLMFFYYGRELYFANHAYDEKSGKMLGFTSWLGKTVQWPENDFRIFDSIGRKEIEQKENKSKFKTITKLLNEEMEKAKRNATGAKSLKFLNRKKKKIENDLKRVSKINQLQEIAESEDLINLPRKYKVEGIKISFDCEEYYKRRDSVYKKIKKLKKAEGILKLRLNDTLEKINKYDDLKSLQNNLKIVSPHWNTKKEKKVDLTKDEENKYEIIKFKTFSLGVGLSAKGNDALRKEWGKKNDIWFHLDHGVSPHLILKLGEKNLDQELFEIVATCMKKYAAIKTSEINLVYTVLKNIKGVKGVAGKVNFKKEKRIQVHVNKDFNSYIK